MYEDEENCYVQVRVKDLRMMSHTLQYCSTDKAYIRLFPNMTTEMIKDILPRIGELMRDVEKQREERKKAEAKAR